MSNKKRKGEAQFAKLWGEVVQNFAWDKVHTAMKALEWKWALGLNTDNTQNYSVPNIATMQGSAAILAKRAFDTKLKVASGGFVATYDEAGNQLCLSFIAEYYITQPLQ